MISQKVQAKIGPDIRPLLPALLLVTAAVVAGVSAGYAGTKTGCALSQVRFIPILFQNMGLALLIASGIFTFSITALLPGCPILFFTGVSMGSAVKNAGGQAVILMLPHGLLEISGWVISMQIGLMPLTTWRAGRSGRPDNDREKPPVVALAKRIILLLLLLTTAAGIETLWVNFYGKSVHC